MSIDDSDLEAEVNDTEQPSDNDETTDFHRSTTRARSYSHLNRRPDTLESIEVNGVTYVIPATVGSYYWAILKVMYNNINQPVLYDELIDGVDEILEEYDAEAWSAKKNKKEIMVWKRAEQRREVKPINPWQDRVISNAKTLCRWRDYGKRLHERGHVLRLEYDPKNNEPYFVLHDNLKCLGQE